MFETQGQKNFPPFSDTFNTIFEEFEMIRNQISIFRKNIEILISKLCIIIFIFKKYTQNRKNSRNDMNVGTVYII